MQFKQCITIAFMILIAAIGASARGGGYHHSGGSPAPQPSPFADERKVPPLKDQIKKMKKRQQEGDLVGQKQVAAEQQRASVLHNLGLAT